MSAKRVVIGLGVVVAIALGIASFKGVIPPKSGFEGAIGAAKRYQNTQISAGDVKLADADMQDLLQSDLFHQIVTDANFREVLRTQSESFRTVLMDKQFRDILGRQGFAEVMRSDLFKQAVEQNRYDLLAKASPADFQRSQLTERTQTLDKANTSDLGARQSAEQLRTQVAQAREELAKNQLEYDKSVTSLLQVGALAAKADVQAQVEAAKAQDVVARKEVTQRAAEYERNLAHISSQDGTPATANRQALVAKVEASRAELAKADEALGRTTAAYQRTVSDLSKLSEVARHQDALGKVEASRVSTLEAKAQVGSALEAYDRQINTALHVDVERASKADSYARAQELSRSEAFRTVFADAKFRELAKSDQFAKLVTLDRFQQIAKMDTFQKAVSNADVWKQVVVADAQRTETVR